MFLKKVGIFLKKIGIFFEQIGIFFEKNWIFFEKNCRKADYLPFKMAEKKYCLNAYLPILYRSLNAYLPIPYNFFKVLKMVQNMKNVKYFLYHSLFSEMGVMIDMVSLANTLDFDTKYKYQYRLAPAKDNIISIGIGYAQLAILLSLSVSLGPSQ